MGNKYSILARNYDDKTWTKSYGTEWWIVHIVQVIYVTLTKQCINVTIRKD